MLTVQLTRQVETCVVKAINKNLSVGLAGNDTNEDGSGRIRVDEEVVSPGWHWRQLLYEVALLVQVKVRIVTASAD